MAKSYDMWTLDHVRLANETIERLKIHPGSNPVIVSEARFFKYEGRDELFMVADHEIYEVRVSNPPVTPNCEIRLVLVRDDPMVLPPRE